MNGNAVLITNFGPMIDAYANSTGNQLPRLVALCRPVGYWLPPNSLTDFK